MFLLHDVLESFPVVSRYAQSKDVRFCFAFGDHLKVGFIRRGPLAFF